jgi:hypothetical protein
MRHWYRRTRHDVNRLIYVRRVPWFVEHMGILGSEGFTDGLALRAHLHHKGSLLVISKCHCIFQIV